jgi:FdhD protein
MENILDSEIYPLRKEKVLIYNHDIFKLKEDNVAVEEPLEIKLTDTQDFPINLAVTMRTPGNDLELVAGFLFSEGIIKNVEDIEKFEYEKDVFNIENKNSVIIKIKANAEINLDKIKRNVITTSSCGICSSVYIDQIFKRIERLPKGDFKVNKDLILELPNVLNTYQSIFSKTGGVHASALFDKKGNLICIMEDVGRHNAMDKLVGKMLIERKIPLDDCIVLFSGRASFELVQKSILAGIPFIVAIGAPSSLAIELAKIFNVTLIGFLRNKKFNVYSGFHRLEEIDRIIT